MRSAATTKMTHTIDFDTIFTKSPPKHQSTYTTPTVVVQEKQATKSNFLRRSTASLIFYHLLWGKADKERTQKVQPIEIGR